MSDRDPRIDLAENLFAAWSSGDAEAPKPYLSPDCVLSDIVSGDFVGWDAIREFFAEGLETWPDLVLAPEEYWLNDKGVALTWVMTATVKDDEFGQELRGHKWTSLGMSSLDIENGVVIREVDYHNVAAMPRPLLPED